MCELISGAEEGPKLLEFDSDKSSSFFILTNVALGFALATVPWKK